MTDHERCWYFHGVLKFPGKMNIRCNMMDFFLNFFPIFFAVLFLFSSYTCILGMLRNFCCFERNLVLGANYDNFCSLWFFTFSAFSDVYLNAVAASPHLGSICTLGPFEQFGRRGWLGSGPTKCQFAPSLTQQPLQSPFWPT